VDQWIEGTTDEAIRTVYFEYLAERFKDDPNEKRRREERFNSGHPHPADEGAIKKGREAFIQAFDTGQALIAARDALYGEFDRWEIKRKEVDPVRYSKDADYHQRMNVLIEKGLDERKQDRHETELPTITQAPVPPALEKVDWGRYFKDAEYRSTVQGQAEPLKPILDQHRDTGREP
jgi:hypothetical protein